MAHAFLNVQTPVEVIQQCRKIPWDSRAMAHRARGRSRRPEGLTAAGNGTLKVYKCKICGAWHLGHS